MNKLLKAVRFLFFLTSALTSINIYSQYFITGQNPASIKWKQITTERFQILYPENYSSVAQHYINTLNLTGSVINEEYNSKIRRISIVLHNQTTTSNAIAAIAPMRLDFFEMPSQQIYPQRWQDQLVLHEYRHTVQQYKLRQGLTEGFYYVFGEQGVAFIMGLYLPFWFIEGDAVYAETIFSSSGRGRIPDFIYPLKAQVLDKNIYKYDKALFGSYRDFVPDHYTLGYQLMAWGTYRYGIELWDRTMNQVARRPYYIVPFTTSLKKHTGNYKVNFYKSVLGSLKQEWWIHDNPAIDTSFKILSKNNKYFTNYLYPNELEDGSIVVEKTEIDDINKFVRIDSDGNEKRLYTPGFNFQESLSVSKNKIYWNERSYDPRWDMRNYSVIKSFDIETGKANKITKKTRYFAPDISNNGNFIITVHISNQSEYALHLLTAQSGELIKTIFTEDNLFFITPHWSNDDKSIVSIVLGKKGKSLVKIDTDTWELTHLLPFSFKEIKWPVMFNNWVVYTGTYEGKDNIYAIEINSGKAFKIFEPRFGANNISFSNNGKFIFFTYYTADGGKLAKMKFDPQCFDEVDIENLKYEYLADRLVKPHTFNLDEESVPNVVYDENKYRRGRHLFHLHSWAPLSIDGDNYSINPGITLLSQNKLSTAATTLAYKYDLNEHTSKIEFGFDYYGWYPVVSFKADYGGRKGVGLKDSVYYDLSWRETNLSLLLSLPLNFTSSKWIKGIQPIVGMNQKFRKMDKDISVDFPENNFTIPVYRFYAYNQYKRSTKDIYPKWGQTIDLLYRDTPFSEFSNSQAGLSAWFYFPGFIRHQGIRVYSGYQKTATWNYSFSNFVAVPRGYSDIFYKEYYSIRSDYAFPVAYPDWNLPSVFYLKRIYSKLFYDYLHGYDNGKFIELSSTGLEIYSDWHFLSILLNINLGIRVSYRFKDGTQFYEFLFGFSY